MLQLIGAELTTSGHVSRTPCLAMHANRLAHHRTSLVARAETLDRSAHAQQANQVSGRERLLRYPDGRVRCIRYPTVAITDVQSPAETIDVLVSYEEDWDPDRWDDIDWAWDTPCSRETVASQSQVVADPQCGQSASSQEVLQKTRHTFDSPADLLRTLNAEGYLQAQQELMQQVQNSYEIHTGSPWIQSRPVFVLIQQQPGTDVPLTYTLKTKVSWAAAEDELSKQHTIHIHGQTHTLTHSDIAMSQPLQVSLLQVLKRRRPDGSPIIHVDQLKDGLVLFEDVADAERYSNFMEADSPSQVFIAQCDAHDVFRNVQDVRSVVVLLRKGSNVPTPQQLAVSLRSKQSLEND